MRNQPTSLYALASHAVGDFPFQTDEMAAEKFDTPRVRAKHVSVYTASFIPFTLAAGFTRRQKVVFLVALWGSHFAIDSRRWNDSIPIWYDQALHVIALALAVALTEVLSDDKE